jgi:hypothetical protein
MTVGGGAASLSWSVFILRSLKYEGVPFNKISFGLFEKEDLVGGNIKWVSSIVPLHHDNIIQFNTFLYNVFFVFSS